jgi:hypothetical protein
MKIKCAVMAAFVSLAFASQALAVLRPMFPITPVAPFNGELIVIGDELVLRSKKKASDPSREPGTVAEILNALQAHHSNEARKLASATSSSL